MFPLKVKRMAAAVEGRRTLEAAAKVPHTRGSSRGPLQQPHDGGGSHPMEQRRHSRVEGEEGDSAGVGGNGARAVALSRAHATYRWRRLQCCVSRTPGRVKQCI
jgi:hypothetical protein